MKFLVTRRMIVHQDIEVEAPDRMAAIAIAINPWFPVVLNPNGEGVTSYSIDHNGGMDSDFLDEEEQSSDLLDDGFIPGIQSIVEVD